MNALSRWIAKALGEGSDEAPASPPRPARAAQPRVQQQPGKEPGADFKAVSAPEGNFLKERFWHILLNGLESMVQMLVALFDHFFSFIFSVLKAWYFTVPFGLVLFGLINSHNSETGLVHHIEDRLDGEITPAAQAAAQERARIEADRDAALQRAATAEARIATLQQERDEALAQASQLRGEVRGANTAAANCQATLTSAREGYISVVQCERDKINYFNQRCYTARY